MTATFQSFTTAALAGYPAAAITVQHNFAPHFGHWALITFLLGFALSIYSALSKPKYLLALNWVTIPAVCLGMLYAAWLLNPDSVGKNAGMVIFFSIFSFGLPFWLPIATLVAHLISCVKSMES